MIGAIPLRANCDAIQQLRSKQRRERARRTTVRAVYCGATLEHLTRIHGWADHYSYYHATKGWRTRRIGAKRDRDWLP